MDEKEELVSDGESDESVGSEVSGESTSEGSSPGGIGFWKNTILSLILVLAIIAVYREWTAMDRTEKGVARDAYVTSIEEVEYTGPDETLADVKYRVGLRYTSSLIEYNEYVYYRDKPNFSVGQDVRVKVNAFDASDIISITGK